MCAAVEMIASEQHFYGISPPAGFLAEYGPPIRKLTSRNYTSQYQNSVPLYKAIQLSESATRSCLKVQQDKSKKKVVFADDRGLALEHVKVMTEPSNIPPFWAIKLVPSPPVQKKLPPVVTDVWEVRFEPPASDYLEFRRRIADDNVSLENVHVKEKENVVDGTVKVKNLDFAKEVIVRSTADGWRTHEDTYCEFLEAGPLGAAYDTFGFRLQLPIHSRKLDFCVCYKCQGNEYWDSNKSNNYTIEKSSVRKTVNNSSARIQIGNSWRSRSEDCSNTPYW